MPIRHTPTKFKGGDPYPDLPKKSHVVASKETVKGTIPNGLGPDLFGTHIAKKPKDTDLIKKMDLFVDKDLASQCYNVAVKFNFNSDIWASQKVPYEFLKDPHFQEGVVNGHKTLCEVVAKNLCKNFVSAIHDAVLEKEEELVTALLNGVPVKKGHGKY